MKIISYNTNGGVKRELTTNPLEMEKQENFSDEILNEIIKVINEEDADVITLQDAITTRDSNFLNRIITETKLQNCRFFELSDCSTVKNTKSGLAILTKHPIINSISKVIPNPKVLKMTEDGKTLYTFDKGIFNCTIMADDKSYNILTHHGYPFNLFNVDAENYQDVFKFLDKEITKIKPEVITGDFNCENYMDFLRVTDMKYFKAFDEVTTIDNQKYDDVLLPKNTNYDKKTIKLSSNHLMLIIDIKEN